ncbi:MAG TPA: FHA domain-containing protein [Ktedonobacteraceae bacterium]|jgi:hypothetical protein|nr:FHA domain-containing protein [Ktedonobacteraceae bacterium]
MEAALQGPFGKTTLSSGVLTIGSSPDNQLVVNDPKVSAHHAEVRPDVQGYSVVDLGSMHGTFVNGQRLDWNAPYVLNPGDSITIGDTTFSYISGESGTEPTVLARPAGAEKPADGANLEQIAPSHSAYGIRLPQELQATQETPASGEAGSPMVPYVPQGATPAPGAIPPGATPVPGANVGYVFPGQYMLPQGYVPQYPQPTGPQQQPYIPPGYIPGTSYPGYVMPYPPGYVPQPQSQPQPAAKPANRRLPWILLAILLIVILVGGGAFLFLSRSTPEKTLDNYCSALQDGRYQDAYNMFSPVLQNVEAQTTFVSIQRDLGAVTACTHSNASTSGSTATANLTMVAGGKTFNGPISLAQDSSSTWKISELLSTPDLTLTTFCNALKKQDFASAYSQLSSDLQSAHSESVFATDFAQVNCVTYGNLSVSGTSGTAVMILADRTSGQTANAQISLAQDRNSNGDWKINSLVVQ